MLRNYELSEDEDIWVWKHEKNGSFSVKSCYGMLIEEESTDDMAISEFPFKFTWEPRIPTNVKFFMWSAHWGRVLTVDMLQRRGVQTPNRYCLCKMEEETLNHLLLTCSVTRQDVWCSMLWGLIRFDEVTLKALRGCLGCLQHSSGVVLWVKDWDG
ncbi:Reverse transcriptase zinc-binding domain [Thalictrum thalictroides]|uniref:Reverse transcriptase zinc-binding domain n=1 Tax=Thalictrum thalictroides TaxID=46969 RepID=A0A7J6USJ2_THATH|nr:Reverse transcriptase zinc-binding domain [Thalictrum thalictroides]